MSPSRPVYPLQGLGTLLLRDAERAEVAVLESLDGIRRLVAAQAALEEPGERGAHRAVAVEKQDRTHARSLACGHVVSVSGIPGAAKRDPYIRGPRATSTKHDRPPS
jgi:hypothetical protein